MGQGLFTKAKQVSSWLLLEVVQRCFCLTLVLLCSLLCPSPFGQVSKLQMDIFDTHILYITLYIGDLHCMGDRVAVEETAAAHLWYL